MKIGIYTSSLENSVEANVSAAILADALAFKHETEIIRVPASATPEQLRFLCNNPLEQVAFRNVKDPPQRITDPGSPERRYQALRDWSDELTRPYDLFINFSDRQPIYCSAPRGVLVVQFPGDFIPSFYRAFWLEHLASYQLKISNSYYTKFWTRMFWEIDCPVIYPPVPIRPAKSAKEDLIVSVGPFGTAQPGNLLELIAAFAQLKERLPAWSLAIFGEVAENRAGTSYFEAVRDLAASEVKVLANPSFEEQLDLMNRARLFWMTSGLGEDLELQPKKAVPFSLPLIHAMAAGCVPLVTNSGGLPEILRHGEHGYFWDTTSELIERSIELAVNEPARLVLANSARMRARNFRPQRFTESFFNQLRTAFGLRSQTMPVRIWTRLVTSAGQLLSPRRR